MLVHSSHKLYPKSQSKMSTKTMSVLRGIVHICFPCTRPDTTGDLFRFNRLGDYNPNNNPNCKPDFKPKSNPKTVNPAPNPNPSSNPAPNLPPNLPLNPASNPPLGLIDTQREMTINPAYYDETFGLGESMQSHTYRIFSHTNFNISVIHGDPTISIKLGEFIRKAKPDEIMHLIDHLKFDDEGILAHFCDRFVGRICDRTARVERKEIPRLFTHLIDTHPMLLTVYLLNQDLKFLLYLSGAIEVKIILQERGFRYSLKTIKYALASHEKTTASLVRDINSPGMGNTDNIFSFMEKGVTLESLVQAVISCDREPRYKLMLLDAIHRNYHRLE